MATSLTAVSAPPQMENSSVNIAREPAYISRNVRSRGSACLRALGGSMFPWIRPGDLLFVRKCEFEAVSCGDVILFERDGRFFVHRVIRRVLLADVESNSNKNHALITKGDALDGEDLPVSADQFLGRVIRIHRRRRHIDLQSLSRTLLARVLARVSPKSAFFYRPMRKAKRLLFASRTPLTSVTDL
jgi:signal peptidase I